MEPTFGPAKIIPSTTQEDDSYDQIKKLISQIKILENRAAQFQCPFQRRKWVGPMWV